jgi:hypothetical protein
MEVPGEEILNNGAIHLMAGSSSENPGCISLSVLLVIRSGDRLKRKYSLCPHPVKGRGPCDGQRPVMYLILPCVLRIVLHV